MLISLAPIIEDTNLFNISTVKSPFEIPNFDQVITRLYYGE